ncbi:hypothetical protein ANCDUO_12823 [Ancylostoma duodenale]|uniref:Uncharacterized protein n=1 Tax=Ancylostoma duodenale TaxID=51022 RepID=A0A0C2CKH7_9BILA|nr:hypothetical protein ANCDUO_12823 [Ancylostoma duodenale]
MVWPEVSATGRSPLIFVEKGTAINTDFYTEEAILEEKACAKRYGSVDALKSPLKKTWEEIPQETLRAAVGFYTKCLKTVITAKGGHIE